RLQLGDVEVRAAVLRRQRGRVVPGEQAQVEQRGRDALAVDQDVLLVQVPAARAHDQHRALVLRTQLVALAARLEGQGPRDRPAQRAPAGDQVVPGRRGRVLEIGRVAAGARVPRVDD